MNMGRNSHRLITCSEGQKQSAKKNSHSPLWEVFSLGSPTHKRIKKYLVFRNKNIRMRAWASNPRTWAIQTAFSQEYRGCRFLLGVKTARRTQIRCFNVSWQGFSFSSAGNLYDVSTCNSTFSLCPKFGKTFPKYRFYLYSVSKLLSCYLFKN